MLFVFIAAVSCALITSGFCSLFEAALLSLSATQVELLAEKNPGRGGQLRAMKASINQPITAILTLNTLAHTIGASVAGAGLVYLCSTDIEIEWHHTREKGGAMPAERYRVELTAEERGELLAVVRRGKGAAAQVRRANILLAVDVGEHADLRMSEAEAARTYRASATFE